MGPALLRICSSKESLSLAGRGDSTINLFHRRVTCVDVTVVVASRRTLRGTANLVCQR